MNDDIVWKKNLAREIGIREFMLKWHSYDGGEHPTLTQDLWREVVCSGHTIDGYWKWAYDLDIRDAEMGIGE